MMVHALLPIWIACALAADPETVPILQGIPAGEDQPSQVDRVKEIRDRLARPVSLEKGFSEGTPLKEALEFLSDRYDFTLLVNDEAFKAMDVAMVEATKIKLPKMIGVKLSSCLHLILAQVHATYLIHPDYVEIVPLEYAHPQAWKQRRDLAAMVQVEFVERPLDEALRELADTSGINIVLDARAGEKAKTSITASLENVPVDTAVLILADMADMRPVVLDNVLYVTSRENAEQLLAWQQKQSEMAAGQE
jgi:hypothetical protein